MAMADTTIGKPIPLGIIHADDADKLGINNRVPSQPMDQLEAIRSQLAELRDSVGRLTKATARSVEAHPVAAVTVVSLVLLACAILTSPSRPKWR